MNRFRVPVVTGVLLAGLVAAAAEGPFAGPLGLPSRFSEAAAHMSMRVVPSHAQVPPGQTFHVALELAIADGWAYYAPQPGGTAEFSPLGASITAVGRDLKAGAALWPPSKPHQTNLGDKTVTTNVYSGRIVAYVPITVPGGIAAGARRLTFAAAGQICSEDGAKCLNLRLEDTTEVIVGAAPVPNSAWDSAISSGLADAKPAGALEGRTREFAPPGAPGPQLTVGGGLGLAILAGLILNIMPCVLPVIPLRIVSLAELARQSRRRLLGLGSAFAAGIMLFFVALAAVNAVLRLAATRAFDWGRHFQLPSFRIGMALLMVALAANLLGAFTVLVPRRLAGLEAQQRRGGYLGSLGMGLMMAILATPCSFAILVLALAWAQVQPLWLGSLAIVLMGAGMAAPHAMLAAAPGLLSRLPRPGRWMELLRQSMGFALLLVAVWLVSTLSSDAHVARVIGYAVVLAFCLWAWGSWVGYDASLAAKVAVRGLAVALAVAAGMWLLRPARPVATAFEPFDEGRIASARAAGRTVLVDFTAAWCLSCKIVDLQVYDDPAVAAGLKARGVLAMRGDVTTADLPANRMLYEELKGAPPLTVIFPSAGATIRLEGKFSKARLFEALDTAAGASGSGPPR